MPKKPPFGLAYAVYLKEDFSMNQSLSKKWGLKLTVVLGVFLYSQMALAVDKYWVGPNGGGFNSGANWANTSGGAGGAGSELSPSG